MKNIHVLPTDKPSKLQLTQEGVYYLLDNIGFYGTSKPQHIYITSDEEINKETKPCWCLDTKDNSVNYYQNALPLYNYIGYKKIILTTDQDLINDGVQAIDDEFLEWFVNNPSCEYVTTYDGLFGEPRIWKKYIIIPKEEPKQETLEEAAEKFRSENPGTMQGGNNTKILNAFKNGAKWQAERMYSAMSLAMKAHESTNHRYNSEFDLDAEITKLNTPDRYDNVKQKYNYSESDIVNLFEQLKNKS